MTLHHLGMHRHIIFITFLNTPLQALVYRPYQSKHKEIPFPNHTKVPPKRKESTVTSLMHIFQASTDSDSFFWQWALALSFSISNFHPEKGVVVGNGHRGVMRWPISGLDMTRGASSSCVRKYKQIECAVFDRKEGWCLSQMVNKYLCHMKLNRRNEKQSC